MWKLNRVMDVAGPSRWTGLYVKVFSLKTAEVYTIYTMMHDVDHEHVTHS